MLIAYTKFHYLCTRVRCISLAYVFCVNLINFALLYIVITLMTYFGTTAKITNSRYFSYITFSGRAIISVVSLSLVFRGWR